VTLAVTLMFPQDDRDRIAEIFVYAAKSEVRPKDWPLPAIGRTRKLDNKLSRFDSFAYTHIGDIIAPRKLDGLRVSRLWMNL
jgi:hypothetical protein